jgi:hypothetical protein
MEALSMKVSINGSTIYEGIYCMFLINTFIASASIQINHTPLQKHTINTFIDGASIQINRTPLQKHTIVFIVCFCNGVWFI